MYVWYYLNGNGTNFLGGLDLFDVSHVKFGPASFDLLKSSGLDNPTGAALAMMQDQAWPIYATGPYQIVFHMKTPFLYLNGLLVGFEGLLFDSQWALQNGGFGTPAQFNPYFDDHPMPGTGPYMVTEVVLNSHVKFAKNSNYWGANLTPQQIVANPILNPGVVQNVIMYAKTDDIARYTDLSTGAAQLSAIRATNWRLVINNPQYDYFKLDTTEELTAVAFNTQISPTNNVNVRQAIAHAINYTDIWERTYFGQAKAFVGPETPNYGIYYNPSNLPPYDYNLDVAKQYLAKAGFPNGQGLPTLEFRTVSGCSICTTASEIIQADLQQIGINMEITALASSAYWAPYGNYATNVANAKQLGHMSFLGGQFWAPSVLSPTDYWSSFVTSSSLWGNWAAYSNPVVDSAVANLAKTSDMNVIITGLKTAQTQIYNDVPYAWIGTASLWYVDGSFVWNKALIKQVWFDPAYTGINTAPLFNTIVFAGT
jgi:ABC-type transport system substrate-binding protein